VIRRLMAACVATTLCSTASTAQAPAPVVEPQEWSAYKQRFIEDNGRVVDDGNGKISHSEGQGYGLILAWLAGNREDFERVWSFTLTNLMLRDDGLAVWKWDPFAKQPVTDPNNASDGDMLIAYALALAGAGWNEARFTTIATQIAQTLGQRAIYTAGGHTLLRPGMAGFGVDDSRDGPVVNLSYWVFEALPVLAALAPDADWAGLEESGLELIDKTTLDAPSLPADWLSVANRPRPAENFPAEFGYNALRIPLYLVRARRGDEALLRRLRDAMTDDGGSVTLVDLHTGKIKEQLADAGYRIIPALVDCVLDGTAIPQELRHFQPTLYYPSTLQLLALAHAREARRECL
jgi:endo-1,4-beta-D-glucanase Y